VGAREAGRRRARPRRTQRAQLADALGALDVALSAEEVAALEAAVLASDVAGTRYDEHPMRALDSER
jgi:hypothetical protein